MGEGVWSDILQLAHRAVGSDCFRVFDVFDSMVALEAEECGVYLGIERVGTSSSSV